MAHPPQIPFRLAERPTLSTPARYGIAVACALSALGLNQIFSNSEASLGFLLFAFAVGASTWFGGGKAGVLAIVISSLLSAQSIHWRQLDLATLSGRQAYLRFAIFVALEIIISGLTYAIRSNRDQARRSDAKFRAVADTASSAIFIFDPERFVFVNRATELMSGYSREELLESGIEKLLHPDSLQLFADRLQRRLAHEPVTPRIEFKIITKLGVVKWLDYSSEKIEFENGWAILATAFDVTDRKRDQQLQSALYRIAESASNAEDLQECFRSIHCVVGELMVARNFFIALLDPTRTLITFPYFVDEKDEQPAPSALSGKGLTDYVITTGEALLLTPEKELELTAAGRLHSIGSPCVDWIGVPLKYGEDTIGAVVVQTYSDEVRFGIKDRDILVFVSQQIASAIKRKQNEKQLRESEERYRTLVQSAVHGLYRASSAGRFLDVNLALVRILGYDSMAELYGLNMETDVYVDRSERRELLRQFEKTGRAENVHVRWKRKDGEIITVKLSGRGLIDADNGEIIFEIIAEDVTERRHLEDQLRQSQKMEAVGRLAGGVAHDFNNLLTVMKGYGDLLREELAGSSTSIISKIDEMNRAADRAALLTKQLLAFSRQQMLAPKVFNLNDTVRNMHELLRRLLGEDVELVTMCRARRASVRADSGQIEQVLMNLAVNARDAMPRGGKLTIETAEIKLTTDYSNEHFEVSPGNYVLLAVSDTGIGMDTATRQRVFEPFFTTKEQGKGTGLGLSTAYGIISQSGGHVFVYSEPGIGTTFKVYLPQVEAGIESGVMEKAQLASGGGETVMVVEDEHAVRDLVKHILVRSGYHVLTAKNGEEACTACHSHDGPIALLLTDVVLAKGSGREVAEQLSDMRPEMRVLYMSGYTDDAIVRHGVLDANTAFLQKPFTPDILLGKIREVLDLKAPLTAKSH